MPNLPIRISTAIFLAASLFTGSISHQAPPHEFEVASIRMVASGHTLDELKRGIGLTSICPWGTNKFTARNATLQLILQIAFNQDDESLIVNKPDWLASQQYDILAEADTESGLTLEQMRPLIRHLLETRFHLKTHTEPAELPGYALVVAKGTPQLTPSKVTQGYGQILPNAIQATGYTMAGLASVLRRPVGKPVVDRTGIAGTFDIKLSYAPENATDSTLPSIFTAIQEQLGLKLQPEKISVQRLIIDHIDKVPTAD